MFRIRSSAHQHQCANLGRYYISLSFFLLTLFFLDKMNLSHACIDLCFLKWFFESNYIFLLFSLFLSMSFPQIQYRFHCLVLSTERCFSVLLWHRDDQLLQRAWFPTGMCTRSRIKYFKSIFLCVLC